MLFLLKFTISFWTIFFSGLFVSKAFSFNSSYLFKIIIGYLVQNSIFAIVFFFSLNSRLSFISSLLIGLIVPFVLSKNKLQVFRKSLMPFLMIYLCCVTAILVLAPKLVFKCESCYFLSASEDVFDAVNGGLFFSNSGVDKGEYVHRWDLKKNVSFASIERTQLSFLSFSTFTQYSSIGYFNNFGFEKFSFSGFLVNFILVYMFSFFWLFLLLKDFLNRNKPIFYNIVISLFTFGSYFYFRTYLSGHEGSMIFMGLIGLPIYLAMRTAESKKIEFIEIAFIFITFTYLVFTYPHPLAFFLPPIIGHIVWAFKRDQLKKIIKIRSLVYICIPIVVIITGYLLYTLAIDLASFKSNGEKFRSWGVSFSPYIFLVYWGLMKEFLSYDISLLVNSSNYIELHNLIFTVAFTFSLLSISVIVLKFRNNFFIISFIITSLLCFPVSIYIVKDSYYFYKFLYMTHWIFVLGFLLSITFFTNRILKTTSYFLFIIFCLVNLYWNTVVKDITTNIFVNRNIDHIKKVTLLDKEFLFNSNFLLPNDQLSATVELFLASIGVSIDNKSSSKKYLIKVDEYPDVADANNFSSDRFIKKFELFSIYKNSDNRFTSVKSYWQSELEYNNKSIWSTIPFRWISNSQQNIKIYSSPEKIQRVCFEVGPGATELPIVLNVNNNFIQFQRSTCEYLLANKNGEISIKSKIVGKNSLPYDDRELNFRFGHIAHTSTNKWVDDNDAISFFNPKEQKIIGVAGYQTSKENQLFLGKEWYSEASGLNRWGGQGSSFVIKNLQVGAKVQMFFNLGPDLSCIDCEFQVKSGSKIISSFYKIDGVFVIELNSPPLNSELILNIKNQTYLPKFKADFRRLEINLVKVLYN